MRHSSKLALTLPKLTNLKDGEQISTLERNSLTLYYKEGSVSVNNANVKLANVIVAMAYSSLY